MKELHHRFKTALTDEKRDAVAVELQATLVDLIELTLQAKQLHWVVVGPRFRAVHQNLDELTASFRTMSDAVAERCTAIGTAPDGRSQRVASTKTLPALPEGFLTDDRVVALITARVLDAAQALRKRVERVAKADPVSEDLLLGFLSQLEEHAWMLQAQNMTADRQAPAARAAAPLFS